MNEEELLSNRDKIREKLKNQFTYKAYSSDFNFKLCDIDPEKEYISIELMPSEEYSRMIADFYAFKVYSIYDVIKKTSNDISQIDIIINFAIFMNSDKKIVDNKTMGELLSSNYTNITNFDRKTLDINYIDNIYSKLPIKENVLLVDLEVNSYDQNGYDDDINSISKYKNAVVLFDKFIDELNLLGFNEIMLPGFNEINFKNAVAAIMGGNMSYFVQEINFESEKVKIK